MQPYFFPYLGYYQLMTAVDRWVVFDVVQYNRKSWMNRNRVLKAAGGWQYIGVPVSAQHGAPIREARVVDAKAALRRILGQLACYRKAPHYPAVCALVEQVFDIASDRLLDLNVRSLTAVMDYLGIAFEPAILSQMGLPLGPVGHAGQWALEISSALGAETYVNSPGGRSLFLAEEWRERAIGLKFLDPAPLQYATGDFEPEPHLSILDTLMWNDRAKVAEHLKETIRLVE